jgi:hypothetical protein
MMVSMASQRRIIAVGLAGRFDDPVDLGDVQPIRALASRFRSNGPQNIGHRTDGRT